MRFRDRVRELRKVRAGDLVPDPRNWRTHPKAQRRVVEGLLAEVGYADALLARELPDGRLVLFDGHLRSELDPDAVVPVLVVDITEEEAGKLLATLDPSAAMAEADSARLDELLSEVETESDAVTLLLAELAEQAEAAEPGESEANDGRSQLLKPAERILRQVRAVLFVEDVGLFERALAATGEPNRGEALLTVCRGYLREKGQHDVPPQGQSSTQRSR